MRKALCILALVLLLCCSFACQDKAAMAELEKFRTQAAAEEQHKADLKKLAEKYQEAVDNKDTAALAQLYAEDATLIASGEPEPIQGREAIERSVAAIFRAMPDFHAKFTPIVISGNYIVFEVVSQGTFTGPLASPEGDIPPTGKSVIYKVAFIAKVNADGLIEEDRTYYDTAEFMRQLGLVK
jgi:steroid delta-isomerase-like uncharacterized protein